MENHIEFFSIKAPLFLETAANAWFAILEAQFHLRSITSVETKFYHPLSALPPEIFKARNIQASKTLINIYEQTKP